MTNLAAGTTYYAELLATNGDGTTPSSEISFTTPAAIAPAFQSFLSYPTSSTSGAVSVSFLSNGAATTCGVEYVSNADYDGAAPNPYAAGGTAPCDPATQDGPGTLTATASIPNLAVNTGYHVRVTLSNTAGQVQQEASFTTSVNGPAISNLQVGSIGQTSATINADIDTAGSDTRYGASYGPTSALGSSTTGQLLTASSGPQPVSIPIGDLTPGQTYNVELDADNAGGHVIALGTFKTVAGDPKVFVFNHPKPESSKTHALFTFGGDNIARYECQVDFGGWAPCNSATGVSLSEVSVGDHIFQLRGYNADGVVTGPTPVYWTVDAPAQCVLQVARTRENFAASGSTINQVINYKSHKAADVTIKNKVKVGHKTYLLPQTGAQFKTKAIFSNHVHVMPKVMAQIRKGFKANDVSSVTTIHVNGTSATCDQANTRVLNVVKQFGGKARRAYQLFQSDSIFLPQPAAKQG